MSSAVLTALLVLQVSSVHGTSLVLNGAVGESIVLPTDEEGPIRGPGYMEWRKNNVNVIRLVREQDSSPFETDKINAAFEGRLIMNYETGALNISSLREEDSGEYDFTGIVSGSLRPKTIQLHIYERIVSVQVTSQVNNSTDGTSCNVTLSCSVIGGSQVVLSWSRNGENIAGAENRATLSVSPTRAEENYTCTAINPISSLNNTVTAGPCQTVLQVSSVHGTSLVLNGAVGESIVLPTDEEGPIRGPGVMEWRKNNVNVIRLVSKQGSSSFETDGTNAAFKGRLIVSYETGALSISSLRKEDSGEYLFEGIGSSASLGPKKIQLHIYERIVSMQVTSQVNNSTDDSSCNVTLSCSVIGGSQVVLSWSRNGENIARAENRTTLTVSPTRAEEYYTCMAINPVSSLSNTVTAGPCQTGTGEALFTVNGIVNGSVTLPSGSPYNSPSEVQWRIDNSIIVFYLEPDTVTTDAKRFGDRLHLNTNDGSLQINRAQMADADTYTVEVSQGKSKHNAVVQLMIYEWADMPILEVLTNMSGPQFCNVSVRCATIHGLWVASLCQLTQGKLVCRETARNDSAHSARLLITATRDAINCSSSNPASTSSAPLLPVTQVCPTTVPVSRAEESLFVRKGGSVRLDVQGYEKLKFRTISWTFNSGRLVNFIHKIRYLATYVNHTRVEFDQKNFSLLLTNVQESDSGIYTAKIIYKQKTSRVATYRLTVQEAPPTPQVGVALLSSAGGFCNVSVNCSAKDTWASYTCDHAHCTQVANTTSLTGVNIIVTATNGTIHCNSSNRVETKTRSESTKTICTPIPESNSPVGVIVAVVAIIIIIIIVTVIVFVIYNRRRKSGESQIQEKCNTEYASVEGPAVVLSNTSTEVTVYETVTTAKPEHHPKVSTVYDTLGPAGDPPTKPESIYATVNKGAPQPLEQ
ncbi:uncharacterized protein LOC135260616 [Anguilla rostrata]|uniref:uncharacterized protein LOC135260616 n=1 Tax=Anguilla rostrata TaxID=7938 RepID=UPI0030CF8526